jgi:hypothetical protein
VRYAVVVTVSLIALVSARVAANAPAKAVVVARTQRAVERARAQIAFLSVKIPERSYDLRIRVHDPAAFLKYRAPRMYESVNAVSVPRFQHRFLVVVDDRLRTVFRYRENTERVGQRISSISWYILPSLEACAETLPFDVEFNPDGGAPPCPA